VDDDPNILDVVSELLDMEGYRVTTAANGAEALRVVEQQLPSLVLLDMRMPVLDGWGFAKELRARGVTLPILVMTAAQNARVWAEEIGAQGYVAKPFEVPALLDAVEKLRAN
ncbi:MAG TPA: response regulator, partial [Chloroflexota bacterium]|nr:response regulator [Chloroflexota bacterium]